MKEGNYTLVIQEPGEDVQVFTDLNNLYEVDEWSDEAWVLIYGGFGELIWLQPEAYAKHQQKLEVAKRKARQARLDAERAAKKA